MVNLIISKIELTKEKIAIKLFKLSLLKTLISF